ncbi:MAG: DUF1015 domain-containing protein [Candidatus Omnitrophota bacterium]|nr:MAG: DUF1015 domain-containing protein [Candidatus Omnitrophota bacterium]
MLKLIKPFKASYYNPEIIQDLSTVVCPPYDVIGADELQFLRTRYPYNYCKILLATDSDYRFVGKEFKRWLKEGILVSDEQESLYLYEQKFTYEGKVHRRFGILSLLCMNRKGMVFPHEYTLKKPKIDRKRITEAVKANLGPIFVIAPTTLRSLQNAYKEYSCQPPFFEFVDSKNIENKVWKIAEHNKIKKICDDFEKARLVIADGHHRFEVSYDYFKRNRGRFKDLNYVMAYITDAQEGLLILPTHRVVEVQETTLDALKPYFYIEDVNQNELQQKLEAKSLFSFGIYKNGSFKFLRLKKAAALKSVNPIYRKLDTYLLHQLVLPRLKPVGEARYTHSIEEAKQLADNKRVAFLLKPSPLKEVFAIANKGARLPQKSTYFYPKLLSGIVIRRFEK